jgi:hypothetical protein
MGLCPKLAPLDPHRDRTHPRNACHRIVLPLGRLETRVALEELIPLLDGRDSVESDPPMIDSYIVRGRSRVLFQ